MEWGSVADWFSGIVTAIGILLSLYFSINRGKLKFEFILSVNRFYELTYSIINHSDFDVRVANIILSFRKNKARKSEFSRYFDESIQGIDDQEVLKINVLRKGTFQFHKTVHDENNAKDRESGRVSYWNKLVLFNSDEFRKIKNFYVVIEVLAQDGKIYRSKPKKFKLSDITYLKADEDWSKI